MQQSANASGKELRQCDCGEWFEAVPRRTGPRATKCPACKAATKKEWRTQRRKRLRISDGVRATKRTSAVSFQEIANALKLRYQTVNEAYRIALFKLRQGGGEALRGVIEQKGLNGLMEVIRPMSKPEDDGRKLLEYQMRVAEMWESHNKLVTCGDMPAALQVKAAIGRFQKAIGKAINQYLR